MKFEVGTRIKFTKTISTGEHVWAKEGELGTIVAPTLPHHTGYFVQPDGRERVGVAVDEIEIINPEPPASREG